MSTNISWTDETWTVTTGCKPLSAGCAQCYAATMTRRLAAMRLPEYQGLLGKSGHFNDQVRCLPRNLDKPLHWRKPRRVFVDSMSDLFHPDVPFSFIDRVFSCMAACRRHTFQVLTKRPERMADYLATGKTNVLINGGGFPLPNLWIGSSVENQAVADERILQLLQCPAAVRFLSCEPLLGAVTIPGPLGNLFGDFRRSTVDWVIVGCESGPRRRPCDPAWIRSIVDQCAAADVPCFVKQMSINGKVSRDPAEWPKWAQVQEFPIMAELAEGRG